MPLTPDEKAPARVPLMSNVIITESIPAAKKLANDLGHSFNRETNPKLKPELLAKYNKQKQQAQFLEALPEDLEHLNNLIDNYNGLTDQTEKLTKLHEIHQKQLQIEHKYPTNCISSCPSYQEAIHFTLFKELKQQFASLGITSLHEDALKAGPQPIGAIKTQPTTLPEILANMAPEKVSLMLDILSKGALYNQIQFLDLYDGADTEEARVFKQFFTTHSIEFLGGLNSKNFKITDADGSSFILNAENRLTMPKDAEMHLRHHSLSNKLTPIYAERQASYTTGDSTITRSVLITDFCKGGNLEDQMKQCATDESRLKSAFNFYGQMGAMLEGIQQDGAAFPDMKNTNWLVNEKNILNIADTKSLAFADTTGHLDYKFSANKWYHPIVTYYVSPPELITRDKPPSVDKLHSYMIGKNLYQYLSNCSASYLGECNDGKNYDFTKPIFQTEQGRQLKSLIITMVEPDPNQRIELHDALSKLKAIQLDPHKKKKCHTLLQQIQTMGFGEQDIAMKQYLLQKSTEIDSATYNDEVDKIETQLIFHLRRIKDDTNIPLINSCIKNAPFFTKNMNQTLNQIITTMSSIPITERNSELRAEIKIKKDLATLDELKYQIITCNALLNSIQFLELHPVDPEMTKFIQKKRVEIAQINTDDGLNTMVNELTSTRALLEQEYRPIAEIMRSYYDRISPLSIGMKAKGTRIQEAMLRVPVEERHSVMEADTPEARNVRKALASKRTLWKKKTEPSAENTVTPTESFKELKSKLVDMDKSTDTDKARPESPTKARK